MSDQGQRDAMRKWPTHEVHGEPGFVTCRLGIIVDLIDEAESADRDLAALRADVARLTVDLSNMRSERDMWMNSAEGHARQCERAADAERRLATADAGAATSPSARSPRRLLWRAR